MFVTSCLVLFEAPEESLLGCIEIVHVERPSAVQTCGRIAMDLPIDTGTSWRPNVFPRPWPLVGLRFCGHPIRSEATPSGGKLPWVLLERFAVRSGNERKCRSEARNTRAVAASGVAVIRGKVEAKHRVSQHGLAICEIAHYIVAPENRASSCLSDGNGCCGKQRDHRCHANTTTELQCNVLVEAG